MKYQKFILCSILCFCLSIAHSQSNGNDNNDQQIISWLESLSEPGVKMDNDSLIMNAEAERLLSDAEYRKQMYPKDYTWEKTMEYVSNQELSKAFWFMINLYRKNDKNKELVLRSILTYDQVLKMDKVLVSCFYTYIYMDLETSEFVNGVPEVKAPDIMEDKLNTLKDILYFIGKFRENKNLDIARDGN